MPSLKIHQYQLYDIPMQRSDLISFATQTFDFVKKHEKDFYPLENPYFLFHNKLDKYSSIQFGIKNKSLTLTAYGEDEIIAVEKWLALYVKEKRIKLNNTLICKELYTLDYLPVYQNYRIQNFIVHPDVRKSLWKAKNSDDRLEIMETYLWNNFKGLYNHIGYWQDGKQNDKVSIHKYQRIKNDFFGFKGKKLTGYDIFFSTKLRLPHILRLGLSTALGYGEVSWM